MRADSRAVGVAAGVSGKDKLLLEHIYREASLREGDIIVTSGYSGSHPADILIGKVTATHMDSVGLLQEADIVPAFDIADVEQVLLALRRKRKSYYREDRQNEETDLARPVSVLNAAAGFDVRILYRLAFL